jgi:hypothetical protein
MPPHHPSSKKKPLLSKHPEHHVVHVAKVVKPRLTPVARHGTHTAPPNNNKKKTWKDIAEGYWMGRFLLVLGILASAGVVIGILAGVHVIGGSSSSSSGGNSTGGGGGPGAPLGTGLLHGTGLAPLFVMNAYPSTVAPGEVVASNFWDGSCDAFTFEVPQAAELGVKQQSFVGNVPKYVLYQSGRTYDAQRVVPITPYGDEINIGAISFTINFWAWFGYVDPSADYVVMGSDASDYDGPLVMMDHASGWCLADNTNRGKCPGSTCIIPPGFVCSSLNGAPINVWNMVTLVYTADGASSTYQAYVNASIVGVNTTAAHTMAWSSGFSIMDVDTSGTGNSYPGFPGSIYQPAMWLSALNGGQITQIFGTSDLTTLFSC